MNDWLGMGAAELGREIGAGRIDPVALAQAFLDAIAVHPLRDRIYARVTPERALAEAGAAAARARTGQRRGPLDGVPASWKDLFDTAGTATEAGTALLAGRVPDRDAEVLRVATGMGLVCLGKTHMSEIAFSGLGYNPVTGTPPCVNDAGAVPGGSSSGAAASVAFGLAPLAIGSDTGGSVRIPSVWNDLVGFKPTHGALSLEGVVPLCKSFDTVGPLCRTVEDAALAYAALRGEKPADLQGASLADTRLLALETVVLDGIEDVPLQAHEAAIARLEAAGATVTRAKLPFLADAFALTSLLYPPEAYAQWRDLVEAHPERMYHQILDRVRAGASVLAHDFIAARDALHGFRARYLAETAGFDAVICPGAAILPPQQDRLAGDDAYYKEVNLITLRNTRLANLMGLTSLALPVGVPSCGMLLNMAPGSEARLLRLGMAAEAVVAGRHA